ncbi:LssY C-terminal domain-containing protein [Arthrobacter sp. GMC3]|uniref:LssY C-terminal domain-containing protein n=1 Tax=Arthrobacter sp. GMC3 TaxID=2058894 RepID=UPI002795C495|nr:LssY C-terminal domain-containing protein [Arthrobacter sp. GMC3]
MSKPTVPTQLLAKSWSDRWHARRRSVSALVDNLVFVFSGIAALWLAWLVLSEGFTWGWYLAPFFVLFWLVLAYLVLPRLHRILTSIYVPDYFIGRARTSDGLLGDPINLAVLGTEAQLHEAMTRAGWIRADEITLASSRRIITSTIFRRSYDEAPVSPLLLFGRQQDLAYQQEVEGNPAKRHHVRFWRCPEGWMLPGGHTAEWLAAGTFDRAVGFSLFTLQITHKIDADTDTERDHIVATLVDCVDEVEVRVIEDFSTGYHSRNGGGDTIETDGDLPVLDLRPVKIPANGNPLGPDLETRRAARAARRPVSTSLGVLLMVIRVVVGAISVAMIVGDRGEIIKSAASSVSADEAQVLDVFLAVVSAVFAVTVALYLLLTFLVFRGSNWARNAAMAFSAVLVVLSALAIVQGEAITLGNSLFGLPLDILVLLALSARSSRLWARRDSSPITR